MKYFLDTEFCEYTDYIPSIDKSFDTIDLLSIGITDEEGNSLYLINSEFNVRAAFSNLWLVDNVLRPMFEDWAIDIEFNTENFNTYLKKVGITRKEIAEKIKSYIIIEEDSTPEFYAYYGDYDWVVFCWIFGRMIDLPKGFPKYCRDIKQMVDEGVVNMRTSVFRERFGHLSKEITNLSFDNRLEIVKRHESYPEDGNHNALIDAEFNKNLYQFVIDYLRN